MAKDQINNELKEGQLVQIQLDNNLIRGHIQKITEGGMLIAGGNEMQAGMVVVMCPVQIPYDPRNPMCRNLLRVVDPDEGKKKLLH